MRHFLLAAILGTSLLAAACAPPPLAGEDDAPEQAFPGQSGKRHRVVVQDQRAPWAVTVEEIDGQFVLDGDMVLERDALRFLPDDEEFAAQSQPLATVVGSRIWPNALVPYTVDPALSNPQRVTDALAHWEANTVLRFVPRTNEAAYVTFRPGSGCSATLGRSGGQQYVTLSTSCSTGSTMHEVGHAIGLYHEQARSDRDANVVIHYENVEPGKEQNFQTYVERNQPGADVGVYDIGSLMHYGSFHFSANGQPTITRLNGSTFTANRQGLSPEDINGVGLLYGFPDETPPTVTISSPSSGALLRGEVTATFAAMDDVAVAQVELRRAGSVLCVANASPWACSWDSTDVPDGEQVLTARAFDAAGNQADSAPVAVTVHNVDTAPPEVVLQAPAAAATVHGEVLLLASASDDFGVTELTFFVNDQPHAVVTGEPWEATWNTEALPDGPALLHVRARDAAGNATDSPAVSVTVQNEQPEVPAPGEQPTSPGTEPGSDPDSQSETARLPPAVGQSCAGAPSHAAFGAALLLLIPAALRRQRARRG